MRNRSVRVRRWGPLVNELLDPPRKNFRGKNTQSLSGFGYGDTVLSTMLSDLLLFFCGALLR